MVASSQWDLQMHKGCEHGMTTLPFRFAPPPEADMTQYIPFWQITGVVERWLTRNYIILASPVK